MAAAVVAISSDAKTDVKENETWSKVVVWKDPNETVLPIVIMEREILTKEEAIEKNPIKEEELYHSRTHEILPNHLRSVQRVRALCHVYILSKEEMATLLIRGMTVRGKHVVFK